MCMQATWRLPYLQQVVYGGLPFGLVPFGLPSGGADMAAIPAAHQQLKPQVVSGEQVRGRHAGG